MDRLTIYSYNKVWKVEKKIYAIQNLKLPVPVNPYGALYFAGAALFILFLGGLIPFIEGIPVAIRYIAIPYGISVFLLKKKLDGKNPLKYFVDYVKFTFTEKNRYIERFAVRAKTQKEIKLEWCCSRGSVKPDKKRRSRQRLLQRKGR